MPISPRASLNFARLPLVEVSLRFYLTAKLPIDFNLVNTIKDRLGFRDARPAAHLEVIPGLISPIPDSGAAISAAEFAGRPDGMVATLQTQLLAARWRGNPAEGTPYVRFSRITELQRQFVQVVNEQIGEGALPLVGVVNVTYVNFVQTNDPRPFIAEAYVGLREAETTRLLEIGGAWEQGGGIDFRYHIQHGTLNAQGAAHSGYVITTACGKRLAPTEDPHAVATVLHDLQQGCFFELITDHAKQQWELQE